MLLRHHHVARAALLIFALAAWPAAADIASTSCVVHAPVDVLISYQSTQCFGFVIREGGQRHKAVLLETPVSGEVVGSADGRSVAFVATRLPLESDIDALYRSNPIVTHLYKGDQLIGRYRLQDLVARADLSQSVSHLRWLAGSPATRDAGLLLPLAGDRVASISLDTGAVGFRGRDRR